MERFKSIINNVWFFPSLVLCYGIFYIFFGELYYLNEGLSTDGAVFSDLIQNFNTSYFFDTYYVHRIFPSLLVATVFKIFSITHTTQNVILSFQILNIISLILTCYFVKKILLFFKVSLKNQLLGFVLLIFNFSFLKYPFYLPVMTDNVALALSAMLLYFYFKKKMFGLIFCTLISCFTWQLTFYQGLIFITIPFSTLKFSEFKNTYQYSIKLLSGFAFGLFCIYLIYVLKMDTTLELVARINRDYVNISILGVAIMYYYFSFIFLNKNLFNVSTFLKSLKLLNVLIALGLLGTTIAIVYVLHPVPNKFYPLLNILSNPFTHAMMWPLHTIVSHVAFWGVVIILLLFFWKDFCKLISQLGWGLVFAIALNVYAYGIMPETRCIMNLLPWIVVLLIKAINKYSFSNIFYIVVSILSVVASKIWMLLNDRGGYLYTELDKNGSLGFPDQKLWLNVGPWMSESMYYLQGVLILGAMLVLFLLLYKIKRGETTGLQLAKRYQIK